MYSFAIEAEMGYTLSRLEIDGDWCDSGDNDNNNSINGGSSSSSQGPKGGKLVNSDNEVAQITKLRSEPNERYSRGKRGLPISPVKMLAGRECNFSGRGRFTAADCCHVLSRYLPVNGPWRVDKMDSRAYVSQFSADGSLFVAGFQGSHIRIYNVENGWKVQKDIHAKSLRWTVTDTSLSPDQDYLVYASMSPIVHIVNIRSAGTESLANINEIHDGLDFSVNDDGEDAFGIFSVKFSTDGRELVAGSSDDSIYVYDLIANKLTLRIAAHSSDVNTVCFADETGHLIYSGSDDNLCKVWDRRCLNANGRPAGVLMGHLEGITFLDSRGDGRYFISNGKDQTIKLWDIRKLSSNSTWRQLTPKAWVYTHEKNTQLLYDVLARSDIHIGKYCMHVAYLRPKYRHYDWDYRWMEYPSELRDTKHPYDQSLSTYKGHSVLRTLIRCYFSPAYSTGQKYIYTGSNDSCVYIYDVVSGAQVARLENHSTTVRDCSWHPFYPMLVSSSWDGVIARCEFPGNDKSPAPMNRRKIRRRQEY